MPAPPRILLCCAVPQEASPLARGLGAPGPVPSPGAVRELTVPRATVLLSVTGIGREQAAESAEALLRSSRPDLVVMAGVAGALAAELEIADLAVARHVLHGGRVYRPELVPLLPGAWTGGLLCSDAILGTAAAKKTARDTAVRTHPDLPPPLAVEMETAGVAEAAERAGVPWAAVRAISDRADEDFPLDLSRLVGEDGRVSSLRSTVAVLARPAAVPALVRLGRNVARGMMRLGEELAVWVRDGCPKAGVAEESHAFRGTACP